MSEPTAETHRTVRISATMETELYLDINVPINFDDHDVYAFMNEGGIDGANMVPDPDPLSGSWTWWDASSVDEFDPTAIDYSIEIKEHNL